MTFNIPNILTLVRLVLIPVFLVLYYLPWQYAYITAAVVFVLAAMTDALDGYLARKLNQSTPFGAFLDPVVDKLMVASALVVLVQSYEGSIWMTIAAIIMIGREIVISALREWMAELGKRGSVAVSWIGKVKTAAQMAAITGLITHYNEWVIDLSMVMLYVATVLTLWSMMVYIKAAWSDLIGNH
ncbi:CDP-diacylglycerol--glycerol-3-phosphate 3-phosphatidyltransferase [Ferrimonas aestuarii]|uniref:CDP-diacylglycerol--glycerol-3-phosphate 3-phosphatidyltransferase n=1 Tax=Ferrimonas aestuarii TaxID=2569539 RepID=A0A4U1BRJ1_9GAMM|nr:CDP-diacylglycerol--glycerol-3-phosphate 3-phosphatidyltransferase [Ferrimonas aestuarii]TKB57390.1 CDP-diacylglycerol--glycerol-3-phosphate 3-phosphatidyltransferase [Ferrimonas aestuarii]